MSAFYSFQYPDCVRVLTDAGFFDSDGILRAVGRKVLQLAGLKLVITGRGDAETVFGMIGEIEGLLSDITGDRPTDVALERVAHFFTAKGMEGLNVEAEFLVAAFSESRGPCHFFIQCHGHWPVSSYELLPLAAQIGGGPSIGMDDLQHLALEPGAVERSDFPLRYGKDIMEAMRQKKGRVPGASKEFYGVGGRCDLTTVSADGVSVKTLHEWPDEIGLLVEPIEGANAPAKVA